MNKLDKFYDWYYENEHNPYYRELYGEYINESEQTGMFTISYHGWMKCVWDGERDLF